MTVYLLMTETPKSNSQMIKDDDELAYRDEVQHLAKWCTANNLELNTQNTKEIIVDFRLTKKHAHTPIYINEAVMCQVLISLASTSLMISPGL